MKKKVIVNLNEICDAMESVSVDSEFRRYLDIQTGEIITISDFGDEFDDENVSEKIDKEPERYKVVPGISSREAYRNMENFIYTIKDEKLQYELSRAIIGRGAFRRFKAVLGQNPEEQIRWHDFRGRIIREKVREWLEGIGLKFKEENERCNWVEEEIAKRRERIDNSINMFKELVSNIESVIEIALFGSLTAEKKIAKDIDLMVFVENTHCIDKLAGCHRQVLGRYHSSPDVFVFTKDRYFLGNICHRKECPSQSVECRVEGCGKIKYIAQRPGFVFQEHKVFKNKPRILWLNPDYKTSISERWYKDNWKSEEEIT